MGKKTQTAQRQDPLSGIVTGIFLVLAGSLIMADNQGILSDSWVWWLAFTGGLLMLAEAYLRTRMARYQRPVTAKIVWGALLTAFGCAQIYDIQDWWPLALVVAGMILVAHAVKTASSQTAL